MRTLPVIALRTAMTLALIVSCCGVPLTAHAQPAPKRNVVFILSDDHRYDFLGFMDRAPEFLETPSLDRMAREGAHFVNAFVSTSLCSPSRASILTGMYMRHHRVADNQRPVPEGTVFFPEYLRQAGYETAFVGKWHMGHDDDDPRPGFDHWASFRGQGDYFNPVLNINGARKTFEGYTTDILTDHALAWLKDRKDERPFLLYLSFKAVHYPFEPAPRNKGRYAKVTIPYPETMANTEANYESQPHWLRERRYSIHGIDHMETGRYDNDPVPSFEGLFRQYCETLYGMDENIGRVLEYLEESGLSRDTLVIYMGDNGFALGEHGFYDKRDAFEVSIRVPMLAWAPGWVKPGSRIQEMVMNIDIAPTMLSVGGAPAQAAAEMDGRSFLPMLEGRTIPWREHILYEYYWEWNFPATPTTFALRTQRYKYIHYHGVWDRDGFYDLETDPLERHNLINVPAFRGRIEALRDQLFEEMQSRGPLMMPVQPPKGERLDDRKLRR